MAAVSESSGYNRMKEVKEFDDSKMGVKGLCDSGITTIPNFFMQPPETLSCINPSSTNARIPIIDLSHINSHEHRPKIIGQIREAAKTWGFFQVINHGVPNSVLNKTIAALKSFHEQPHEVKAKHYIREDQDGAIYASNLDLFRSKTASWHDFIQVSMSPNPVKFEKIPVAYREEVVEWDRHAAKVGETVAELLSEGLGLEAGKLKETGLLVFRTIVGVYYPYCPQPNLTLGLNPHTDIGVLTVLLENQVVGLQVKHGKEWMDVNPLPGSLIINIGETLQIVSNGEYQSVEHRVLANSLQEPRISIVEFFSLDKRDESHCYGPFPQLLTPEGPALYRNFTVKEFKEIVSTRVLDSRSFAEKLML